MSETNFLSDGEFSIERLEAANSDFQLNKLQSEREKILLFSRIREENQFRRTISQITRAQSRIAAQRAAIARAIARNQRAKCRNTQAINSEWRLKS